MEKNLGHATAYGYAKSKGYSGTEEEFAELMADYASVGQSAAQSAEQAAASATSASGSAASAASAAQTATSKASEAVTAADTATTKASEASQSASTASNAATSAGTSAQTATTAATTATTAKTDAETARDAAAQSASEAAASAESIDPDEFNRKIYATFATDTASGSIAHFEDGADSIPMKDVLVHIEPVQEGSGDPSPDNVRPITGWTGCVISHSGADMTNPTTYSITFPTEAGTVYGGTLDVTKGELVVDRVMVKYDGSSDEQWGEYGNGSDHYCCVVYPSGKAFGYQKSICNEFKNRNNAFSSSDYGTYSDHTNYASTYFRMPNAEITTKAEFLAWIAENPIHLCYEVAEPITYTLTPQEITSLLGENNVWADTGNSEVEYRADTKMYVDAKVAAAVSALS